MKFILSLLILLFASCASVDTKLYKANSLNDVKSWILDFQYYSGEKSKKISQTGGVEYENVNRGQRRDDLQLRDDLYYTLKHDFGLPLLKTATSSSGKILIHAQHFPGGGYKLLTVTLLDRNGETIGRLRIENGDRNATYKNESSFTEYAARAISQTIRP